MAPARWRFAALALSAPLIVCGCSGSPGSESPRSTGPSTASAPTAHSPAVPTPSAAARHHTSAQDYLDAVNRLCQALLPKVIAVTHGGSLDVPVKDYLAQQPAHAKLLADFDRSLARVPVPPAAAAQAAALARYIQFANRLDAKRSAAARRGAAAYAREIKSERSVESDPAVVARNAAGFDPSCDAR